VIGPAGRRTVRSDLRDALWLPTVVLTLAAVLLAGLVANLPGDAGRHVPLVPGFDEAAALTALSAIATGMLAFTGLVGAVILLALQFGASQLSPRLLRWLVSRSPAKWALAISVAAFVYTVLAIGAVSAPSASSRAPTLAVDVSLLLVFAAIGSSLYLLHETAQTLRVARLATLIARRGLRVIDESYAERAPGEAARGGLPVPGGPPTAIRWAGQPGVVAGLERTALLATAERHDLVVRLSCAIGDGIEHGSEVFRVWGDAPAAAELRASVVVADERSFDEDPMFALRVLVDIAIRALSPAVNDPTTATQCLHRIEALLVRLSTRRIEDIALRGAGGVVRVVVPSPSWDDFVDLALCEIRSAGAGQFQTMRRLRALLDRLATTAPPDCQDAVARHRLDLDELLESSFASPRERSFASRPDAQGLGGSRRGAGTL
jgi:uncharacterized membrane protein